MKEAQSKKDKAVYEQRVELSELQLKEWKTREESLRRMHDATVAAFKNASTGNSDLPKELEISNALHKKELEELKLRHATSIDSLERQVAELRAARAESDSTLKQLAATHAQTEDDHRRMLAECESRCRELQRRLKQAEDDKAKEHEIVEMAAQVQTATRNAAIEKLQAEHAKEVERLQQQSERALSDIKYLHEQERLVLETRLDKLSNELRLAQSNPEPSASAHLQEIQNNYLDEIKELNAHLDAFKKQSQEEMTSLKRNAQDATKRAETAEREMEKLKGLVRNTQMLHEHSSHELKHKLEKAKRLIETNEEVQGELKRVKKQAEGSEELRDKAGVE